MRRCRTWRAPTADGARRRIRAAAGPRRESREPAGTCASGRRPGGRRLSFQRWRFPWALIEPPTVNGPDARRPHQSGKVCSRNERPVAARFAREVHTASAPGRRPFGVLRPLIEATPIGSRPERGRAAVRAAWRHRDDGANGATGARGNRRGCPPSPVQEALLFVHDEPESAPSSLRRDVRHVR